MKFDAQFATVTELDWMRLAAFIDSEGCITIQRHRPATKRRPTAQQLLRVMVANTDPRMTDWCKEKFGGRVALKVAYKSTHRVCYQWYANSLHAEKVLEGCFNYFLIKREQAEIGLAFRRTFDRSNKGKVLPAETVSKRESFRQKLVILHRTLPETTPTQNATEVSAPVIAG